MVGRRTARARPRAIVVQEADDGAVRRIGRAHDPALLIDVHRLGVLVRITAAQAAQLGGDAVAVQVGPVAEARQRGAAHHLPGVVEGMGLQGPAAAEARNPGELAVPDDESEIVALGTEDVEADEGIPVIEVPGDQHRAVFQVGMRDVAGALAVVEEQPAPSPAYRVAGLVDRGGADVAHDAFQRRADVGAAAVAVDHGVREAAGTVIAPGDLAAVVDVEQLGQAVQTLEPLDLAVAIDEMARLPVAELAPAHHQALVVQGQGAGIGAAGADHFRPVPRRLGLRHRRGPRRCQDRGPHKTAHALHGDTSRTDAPVARTRDRESRPRH